MILKFINFGIVIDTATVIINTTKNIVIAIISIIVNNRGNVIANNVGVIIIKTAIIKTSLQIFFASSDHFFDLFTVIILLTVIIHYLFIT